MSSGYAKGTETKLRIVRAAAELFHKQGVNATSPDEIIEASSTGKGQFYHYFKNKEGVVRAVLADAREAIVARTAPIDYDVASWADLERWFVAHLALQASFAMARGCPFGTIANEITEGDELIRGDLAAVFALIREKLETFFANERVSGRLTPEADAGALADFCMASVQGAMLLGKVNRDRAFAERVVREAMRHLQTYRFERPFEGHASSSAGTHRRAALDA